jgi:tetratricopeptide (TPR) repeat protein
MINEALNNPDKHWIIKSSTRILGPFNLLEVTELLKNKHISIIDEIRQPSGRWSYIRENRMFLEVVRNIRDEIDATSENTMTHSIAHNTITKTSDAVTLSDELTPTPTPTHRETPQFKDVTATESSLPQNVGQRGGAKSYGASGDRRVQGELARKSNFWRWAILGIAGVAAVVVAVTFSQKEKSKNSGFEDLMRQALRYKSLGIYDRSLKAYQKATALGEPDYEAQLQMAPVLISEDRQTVAGRRIYEKSFADAKQSRTQTIEAYLGIALTYMMDGDLKQAEDTLQKALGYEPSNVSAQVNMAIIEFKKGNYAAALKGFDEIYRKNSTTTLALIGRAMASAELAKQSNDWSAIPKLIEDLKAAIAKSGYLRQELSLFLSYMQTELKDTDGLSQGVKLFLNEMPGQVSLYTHPLLIDWRFSQWDYLEKYCAEFYQKQNPTPHLKAVRAVCLMEINRDAEAQKLLKEAMAEAPTDAYVLLTQASYLRKMNMLPEASTILRVPSLQTLPLRDHITGDICIATQDLNCAQAAYTALYNKDQRDVEALYGLAWVMFKKKERALAYDYTRAGLQAEPNYLPLLELRDKMESE